MIFKLVGNIQHDNWGGSTFIPSWLKLDRLENKPYSEYWLGANRMAPSMIEFEGKWLALDRVIDKAPRLLGDACREQFGDELPYLLKILDVKSPLAIQIHPTKKDAEHGFAQENALGVPLDAPQRIYKDRNHKPELLVALSDCWLLHGFQDIDESCKQLRKHSSLREVATLLEESGLPTAYAHIMQADQHKLAKWLLPVIDEVEVLYQQGKIKQNSPDYWLMVTLESLGISRQQLDAALLSFYLFNIVHLKKGESIYRGTSLPHSYLRGQAIELAGASDNVIRGGLTSQYVDIPALLKLIDYREITPKIIPEHQGNEELYLYPTPEAKEFALQRFVFKPFDEEAFMANSASILLVMSGSLYIDLGDSSIHLQQGESAFIGAESRMEIIGETDGYAVIATLP